MWRTALGPFHSDHHPAGGGWLWTSAACWCSKWSRSLGTICIFSLYSADSSKQALASAMRPWAISQRGELGIHLSIINSKYIIALRIIWLILCVKFEIKLKTIHLLTWIVDIYLPPKNDQNNGWIGDRHVNVTPTAEETGNARKKNHADRPKLLVTCGDYRSRLAAGYVRDCKFGIYFIIFWQSWLYNDAYFMVSAEITKNYISIFQFFLIVIMQFATILFLLTTNITFLLCVNFLFKKK